MKYISSGIGSNAPFRAIELDGRTRTPPYGARQVRFNNVTVFGATGECSCYSDDTVDFVSHAFRSYQGGDPYGNIFLGV